MENISFQYPAWYFFFCILLGLAYALALYFRDRSFREQSPRLNWILGTIRFLTVTLLSTLLLAPLLKSIKTQTQKPVIVLAQDESQSIAEHFDETEKAAYQTELMSLKDRLSADYEVATFAFGDSIQNEIPFTFDDKVSNLSEVFSTIYDLYSNRNLGAIILASDGIYNEGSNPVYQSKQLNSPLYTIALGDTVPKRDVILKQIFHNNIAYLGDQFNAQIDIAAQNAAGQAVTLRIGKVEGGSLRNLQQIPISITGNNFFKTQEVILNASQAGVQRYRISLTTIDGEASTQNNSQDFFIDILDARQKILLLANSPHPDISAIKQAIDRNKNYELTVEYLNNRSTNLQDYDFVILHQLPNTAGASQSVIQQLNTNKTPRLFIVGTQTSLPSLNAAQSLLQIRGDGRNTNEVLASLAPGFSLFTISDELRNQLANFPPLLAPFGDFEPLGNGQVLLHQQIGRVQTEYPLLQLGEVQGIKQGVLAAEGIWKWRLFDYLQHNNHELVDELIRKCVQYLSLKEDKRRFRVNLAKNIFNENEAIVFRAELYNESYELVNDPDASLVITDENGRNFEFVFGKNGNGYALDAKSLPVGNYTFRASVFDSGRTLTYNGQFSVQPLQLELYETTADHNLLRNLSTSMGGQLYYPNQLQTLETTLRANETLKPVLYQTSQTKSVINLKWIFFLLLGLLTIEWFFRRYFGGY